VYELPRNADHPASEGRAPSFGGWMLSIPREATQQAAAWEWLKFAAASRAAHELAARQGRPSALANGPGEAPIGPASQELPIRPTVARSVERSILVPGLPISAQLDDIARDAQTQIIASQRPPQPVLEAAARDAQQLLDLWHAQRKRN
jgi:ABC-type glycerol-3-phosphate transport system substrate-binding protein